MSRNRLAVFALPLIVLTVLFAVAAPASAHGYLIRAIPANGAVLESPPSRLQLWFTENLEPKFSQLTLTDQSGKPIVLEDNGVNPSNPVQLSARIPQSLPNGAYLVTIRAVFTSDGHVQTETLVFWVGQQNGQVSATGPTREAVPLEVLWRMISIAAFNVLFGATLLYQVVLLPGWGNPQYKAGRLPPRVMIALNVLMWVALATAAVGTVLALLQQASILFVADLGTVIQNRLWSVVLSSTQFGAILTIRLLLLALAMGLHAGSIYLITRYPSFISLLWSLNSVVTGALLASLSAMSHAAGKPFWPLALPIIPISVDWLHLLANGAWIGGLVTLSIVLPAALAPLSDVEQRFVTGAVLRRFSKIGVSSVLLLIVTGLYNAVTEFNQPSDFTTNYGLTLVAKLVLILPILALALYHHLIIAPGWLQPLTTRLQLTERLERLLSSLRIEAGIGIAVVFVAALLTATPPPPPAQETSLKEASPQEVTVNNLRVKLSVDPGNVGPNTYEVRVWNVDQQSGSQPNNQSNLHPILGAKVRLVAVLPTLDKRSIPIVLDDVGGGSYIGAGEQLSRVGEWNVLVDITLPDTANNTLSANRLPIRAAFRWQVADALPSGSQGTPLQWISFLGVLFACGIIFLPPLFRWIAQLKLHRESVLIGIAAAVATVIMLAFGSLMLSDATQRSDALNNPVPVVVNPVLPDQQSIMQGQLLYSTTCNSCHVLANNGTVGANNTAPDLTMRVPNRRDEALYQAIKNHKSDSEQTRALKAAVAQLSENDIWNIVNYLRTFAP